jgi:hypothetical protein
VEDSLSQFSVEGRAATTRPLRICYSLDPETFQIKMARWLEPEDLLNQEGEAPLIAVQVDFTEWGESEGLYWPWTITHWWGGKVDYILRLSEVRINQSVEDSLFERP